MQEAHFTGQTPFKLGYAAGRASTVKNCPFGENTIEYQEWNRGYEAGRRFTAELA